MSRRTHRRLAADSPLPPLRRAHLRLALRFDAEAGIACVERVPVASSITVEGLDGYLATRGIKNHEVFKGDRPFDAEAFCLTVSLDTALVEPVERCTTVANTVSNTSPVSL